MINILGSLMIASGVSLVVLLMLVCRAFCLVIDVRREIKHDL